MNTFYKNSYKRLQVKSKTLAVMFKVRVEELLLSIRLGESHIGKRLVKYVNK